MSDTTESESDTATKNKIDEQLLRFDSSESVFADRELLDPTHIVEYDRIVGRDVQLEAIISELRVVLDGNRPSNMFLYGPSGTGKSLISKTVSQRVRALADEKDIRVGVIRFNGQTPSTLGKGVYKLAEIAAIEAGTQLSVPKHGVATDEKWDEFFDIVEQHFDTALVILDEIDMFTGGGYSTETAYSELLYRLTRTSSIDRLSTQMSVIAITNKTRLLQTVDSRALSTFSPREVHFDDYDADQLIDILNRRSDAFVDDVLTNDVIPLTAALAASKHGDARSAIDLLKEAGQIADEQSASHITEGHVRKAQDRVNRNKVLEVIRGVSHQKYISLLAVAVMAQVGETELVRSPDAYVLYRYITDEHDIEQYHQETFVNRIKELSTYELVDYSRKSDGPNGGMYLELQLTENPQTIVETILEQSQIHTDALDSMRVVARNQTTERS